MDHHVPNHLHLWWMSMIYQRYNSSDVVQHPHHTAMAAELHQFCHGRPLGWKYWVKWTIYNYSYDRIAASFRSTFIIDDGFAQPVPAGPHSFTATGTKSTWPISKSDLDQERVHRKIFCSEGPMYKLRWNCAGFSKGLGNTKPMKKLL